MYINSPGGVVTSGFGILDTMNYIKPNISTICMGQSLQAWPQYYYHLAQKVKG